MATTIDESVELAAALLRHVGSGEAAGTSLGTGDDVTGQGRTRSAISDNDTAALYRILMDGFSFQGITDAGARGYIARHGNADFLAVGHALSSARTVCPKLGGFSDYVGCGYRKTVPTCANPAALSACPVPTLPLRKGMLNEQAVSLYFLLRDRCGGDLVGFIDTTLEIAFRQPDALTIAREALLAAFTSVAGVSRKLASMMCAELLLAAGPSRPRWFAVGKSMVAVDSLVHAWLHRTGILSAYGAGHLYGLHCFGQRGCEWIIRDLAERLSTGQGGAAAPRELQHAIWRFCATDELAVCNGRRIPAGAVCEHSVCPFWNGCARLRLRKPSVDGS